MLDWIALQSEYDQLLEKLVNPDLDQRKRVEMQKRSSQLLQLLGIHKQVVELDASIADCQKQLQGEPGEMQELYEDELEQCQKQKKELTDQLDDILYPPDPNDSRSVFLELRAGAGGQEAALFVADLFSMYSIYSLEKGWTVSVTEEHSTDIGGYKELIAHIKGKNVYKYLKHESGVHRVQRVPKTETAGRVHTSTVTVAVLPELQDVEVNFDPSDLRIDTYRASGAGGQHVNKTDSAIRITHIPSGLVVTCQDERSQIKNRAKALKILQARLLEQERFKQQAEVTANRKKQVGSGDRAEKIRTYNYPQNRISDHRIDLTLKKLDIIMAGSLDDLLIPLIEWDRTRRREEQSSSFTQS